jgi:Tol biopolymer transport system component/serine/threonine protein kinase
MPDMTGQIIGQYQIEQLLVADDAARLYRAVDLHLDQPVAIRFLSTRYAQSPTVAARVLQQIRTVSDLLHPNIIDVLDYGEHNGRIYLVMEWVPDGSLRDLQDQIGPYEALPLYTGIDLLRQAAEGLSHAEQRGLLHRNIRPECLLLRRVPDTTGIASAYQLKVSDFGIVLPAGNREGRATLPTPGSPAYMSPEQHQGTATDGRSDVYSLGVVLFETATGYLPFESRTPGEAAFKHALIPAPSAREVRPDIPEELSSIIKRCLEKDPSDRFQTSRELADALSVLIPDAHLPQTVTTPSPPGPRLDQTHLQGVLLQIDHEHLAVTPGNPVTLTMTLENQGAFPIRVMLTADGISRSWVRLPPGAVDVPPRSKMSGPIHLLVDRKPVNIAGEHLMVVKAHVPGRTEPAAEARVRLSVLPFVALRLHLDPPVTSGRRRGVYQLTVENVGNERRLVVPVADNDAGDLEFLFEPSQMMLEPGRAITSQATVHVAPRWIGSGREVRSFGVIATSSGSGGNDRTPPVAATFVQLPHFPVWALPVCVLALLLSGLAFTMLPDDEEDDADVAGVVVTITPTAGADQPDDDQQPTELPAGSEGSQPPAGGTPSPGSTTVPGQPEPTDAPAAASPAGPVERDVALIAFTTARGIGPHGILELYVIEPDGSNERPLIAEPGDDWSPAWSNDGTRIAWSSKRHGHDEIYVANADGSEQRRLTNDALDDRFPVWSPDDSLIVFQRGQGVETELYVVSADGGTPARLTNNTAFDGNPSWSPDGAQIAFVSNRTGSNEVYIMNADGSDVEQITDSGGNNFNPLWSPDGERILFMTDRDGDRDIYSIVVDGTDETALVTDPADEYAPAWSPGGDRIAFARGNADGPVDLFVMDADGSNQEMVAEGVYPDDPNPVWSPDGSQIAFLRSGAPAVDIYVVSIADGSETRLTTNPTFDGNITWQIVRLEE